MIIHARFYKIIWWRAHNETSEWKPFQLCTFLHVGVGCYHHVYYWGMSGIFLHTIGVYSHIHLTDNAPAYNLYTLVLICLYQHHTEWPTPWPIHAKYGSTLTYTHTFLSSNTRSAASTCSASLTRKHHGAEDGPCWIKCHRTRLPSTTSNASSTVFLLHIP